MKFYFEGDNFFEELRAAIRIARESVDIELYYLASDAVGGDFAELLVRKAAEGIRVRMIYDAVGCRGTDSGLFDQMAHAGISLKAFNPWFPPSDHIGRRNHRKFFVIDRQRAFLGGFNLAGEYSAKVSGNRAWRDSGALLDDPRLVGKLDTLFEDSWQGRIHRAKDFIRRREKRPDWTENPRQIIPNHGWLRKSLIREEYLSAIIRARRSISITNPYFIPDHGIRASLRRAARRGIKVRLLTAGISDVPFARWAGQATYAALMRAGVRIFEYQGRVLHAKSAVVDENWYTVGTSNIDHLSFFRNLEVNLFGRDEGSARILEAQFDKDLQSSREILPEAWKCRPWWIKLRERFFFFFRFWL